MPGHRLIERLDDEVLRHAVAHGPPDDLTAVQVFHTGQIEPSLVGRDIGDVRHPHLMGPLGHKLAIQDIVRDRVGVPGIGGLALYLRTTRDRSPASRIKRATVFCAIRSPVWRKTAVIFGLP